MPLDCAPSELKVGQLNGCLAGFLGLSVVSSFNFRGSRSGSGPSPAPLRSLSQSVKTVIHSLHFSSTLKLITIAIKNLILRPVTASHYMTDQLRECNTVHMIPLLWNDSTLCHFFFSKRNEGVIDWTLVVLNLISTVADAWCILHKLRAKTYWLLIREGVKRSMRTVFFRLKFFV